MRRRVLPGFGLSLGFAVAYLGLIVLLPLRSRRFMTIYRKQAMDWTIHGLNFLFEANTSRITTLYPAGPQPALLSLLQLVEARSLDQIPPCLC